MSTRNQPSPWSREALRAHLTPERLGSYERAARGDAELAFHLYEWNMEATGAVRITAGMVEVVVRNALDAQLRGWSLRRHGDRSWFDAAPLDLQGRADILNARQRATRRGQTPEIHGKVIAELSLGFWRYLTVSRYLTGLWIPALAQAFPFNDNALAVRRREVERELQRLHYVRNRAAHHEPIHRRDLLADHQAAVRVTGWISPHCSGWVAERSTIPDVVARKPC